MNIISMDNLLNNIHDNLTVNLTDLQKLLPLDAGETRDLWETIYTQETPLKNHTEWEEFSLKNCNQFDLIFLTPELLAASMAYMSYPYSHYAKYNSHLIDNLIAKQKEFISINGNFIYGTDQHKQHYLAIRQQSAPL